MLRFMGIFGLGTIFLVISPKFRESALAGLAFVVKAIVDYGPYSYVVLALAGIGGMAIALKSVPRPR